MRTRAHTLHVLLLFAIFSLTLSLPHAIAAGEDKIAVASQGQQEQSPSINVFISKKEAVPLQAGYIRLKPGYQYNHENTDQTVFDIEFGDNRPTRLSEDEKTGPLVKLEKIDDLDTKNSLVRKEVTKAYRTELSMGLKVSPFSEIYLGRGFLVPRKDELTIDPRDNGWRLRFKFNF